MESKQQEIDESLYSRQLYVMGHEAQKRMASSSVLLAGLSGLGVEVAKNIILAGVKSVTLLDDKLANWLDLSAQFYLDERSLGRSRAEVSLPKLAELNPYVNVSRVTGEVMDALHKAASNVVVLIDQNQDVITAVTEYCHAQGIAVLVGDARGVFGQIFCDLGENFVVSDVDGENAASSIVANISSDVEAVVTVLEETRHNLNTGDVVRLSGIAGMTELNDRQFQVTVKDPFSFEIDCDTKGYGRYERGGYVNQIKQPTTISFLSYQQAIGNPGELLCDFAKLDNAPVLHLCFLALRQYEKNHGNKPAPGSRENAEVFVSLVESVNNDTLKLTNLSSCHDLITKFALTCQGSLNPVCAVLGGILGQEVLKACSGKFMPIKQFFYYDALEALPDTIPGDLKPLNDRYDGQRVVFGEEIQKKLGDLSMFIIGAGAIGCEMVKNFAMMGVSTTGQTAVTDMDSIEKSNLSRQFLFRNSDINKPKSTTAINAVTRMNPQFKAVAYENKVCNDTEDVFNDDFYDRIDMIVTALDNVEARLYVDSKALFYRKVMLESGTLGTKGHTQVIVPHKTENYGATRDPPEKSIPVCTLKHFPNLIEHTLQWAREWFEEIFKQGPEDANAYLKDRNAFYQQLAAQQNIKLDSLKRVKELLVDGRPNSVEDCAAWARLCFEDLFSHKIQQLLHNFPLDRMTSTGTPFWSGAKKPPTPLSFDSSDPLHVEFIDAMANLRASVFSLPKSADQVYLATIASNTTVPEFRPQEGVKIAATDEEMKSEAQNTAQNADSDIDIICDNITKALPDPSRWSTARLQAYDFDKDIDAQMRVVAAVGNLRARNYRIPEADLHTARGIAGKITPAISTTTALVTGAICVEIYKILLDKPTAKMCNTFTNLALPLFTSMEPEPPKATKSVLKGEPWSFTQWDCIDIVGENMTVSSLIAHLDEKYGLELSMLSSGVTILYSDFMDRKKQAERKNMSLKTLYETVSKKKVHPGQRYLIFELIVNDTESGEEVEVPYLRYRL